MGSNAVVEWNVELLRPDVAYRVEPRQGVALVFARSSQFLSYRFAAYLRALKLGDAQTLAAIP